MYRWTTKDENEFQVTDSDHAFFKEILIKWGGGLGPWQDEKVPKQACSVWEGAFSQFAAESDEAIRKMWKESRNPVLDKLYGTALPDAKTLRDALQRAAAFLKSVGEEGIVQRFEPD